MRLGTAALVVILAVGILTAPPAADAQQAGRVYRLGYLALSAPGPQTDPIWQAFIHRLGELGWVVGRNIAIEARYAEGRAERLEALAAELVRLNVDIIVAAALAHRLKDAGITAIFTTDAVRTQETAGPTAKALGIQPKVTPMQDIDGLVKRIRAEHPHDRVLIVNHALNVRAILKAFGHPEGIDVARDDYEPLFVIVPRPEAPPIVVMLRL